MPVIFIENVAGTAGCLVNPPALAKPRSGFLIPADLLCVVCWVLSVVGVRKWPLDKCVHKILSIDICG